MRRERTLWPLLNEANWKQRFENLKCTNGSSLTWPEIREFFIALNYERSSHEPLASMYDIFLVLDQDRDGEISKLDWLKSMRDASIPPMLAQFQGLRKICCAPRWRSIFHAISGAGGEFRCQWKDFRAYAKKVKDQTDARISHLQEIFECLDKNRDGTLSKLEFRSDANGQMALRKLVKNHAQLNDLLKPNHFESAFLSMKKNNKGQVSWNEFQHYFITRIQRSAWAGVEAGERRGAERMSESSVESGRGNDGNLNLDGLAKEAEDAADEALAAFARAKMGR